MKTQQARRKRVAGGARAPPHFLADQLTLSQPGGHIIPTQYYVPPRIFRPCDGPDNASICNSSEPFFQRRAKQD